MTLQMLLLCMSVVCGVIAENAADLIHVEIDSSGDVKEDIADMEVSLMQQDLASIGTERSSSSLKAFDMVAKRKSLYSTADPLPANRWWILQLTASFTDNDGLSCVEGPIKQTIGALALKQAGLQGAMYNETAVRSNTTCSARGYSMAAGEDPTYVGVYLFFQTETDQTAFAAAQSQALEAYGAQYGLTSEMVLLMSNCTAHLGSQVGLSVQGQCDPVNKLSGSWMHHDLQDRTQEHICDSGPFQKSTFSLAVIKTTRQFPQHPYDQIRPGTCNHWGYMAPLDLFREPDHCFAHFGKSSWYLSCYSDPARGFDKVSATEAFLFDTNSDNFQNQCRELGLDEYVMEIMAVSGCHCLPGTEVVRIPEFLGLCSTDVELPAIREWWNGE